MASLWTKAKFWEQRLPSSTGFRVPRNTVPGHRYSIGKDPVERVAYRQARVDGILEQARARITGTRVRDRISPIEKALADRIEQINSDVSAGKLTIEEGQKLLDEISATKAKITADPTNPRPRRTV